MKIGALTFHSQQNYGGILQAYALQEVLNGMGHHSEIIDYWLDEKNTQLLGHSLSTSTGIKRKIKYILLRLLTLNTHRNAEKVRSARTIKFLKEYIPLSQAYPNYEKLTTANNYDAYIVGSDQVWNPSWLKSAFTLDFVPKGKRKIAYAASLGTAVIPDEKVGLFRRMLDDFDFISVRENEAKKALEKICNRTIDWVLDPTLLADSKVWNFVKEQRTECPQMFCYFLGNIAPFVDYAQATASFLRVQPQILTDTFLLFHNVINAPISVGRFIDFYRKSSKLRGNSDLSAGPLEFLERLRNSDYILTNSFHGMALSIVFRKKFNVVLQDTDERKGMNARMIDLAGILGLEKQIVFNNLLPANLNWEIDYDTVHEKLAVERERSMDFLRRALS